MKNQVTIHTLKKQKLAGQKICMVTAYDATFARLFDEAGADMLLVGDSLGMVMQGNDSTLPVTMDQMVYHSKCVTRTTKRAHVVGDMPFMSYHSSVDEAVRNAGRLVAEGGVGSVKLEGGEEFAEVISKITRASIPVMGHLGLTPQSVHKMGGYVVQGRDEDTARKILSDAVALQQAGCYALVLEGVPMDLAKSITARLEIPTIGIGAGKHCDGQVLVSYDLLGLNPSFKPKFVKHYAVLANNVNEAVTAYFNDVREGSFPDEEHSFRGNSVRLVSSNPEPTVAVESDEEKTAVYGAPV